MPVVIFTGEHKGSSDITDIFISIFTDLPGDFATLFCWRLSRKPLYIRALGTTAKQQPTFYRALYKRFFSGS